MLIEYIFISFVLMASACPLYMFSYRRFADFRDFETVWHGSQAIQNLLETEN